MEISLPRQFACSHCGEALQRENWNRTEVPFTQNDVGTSNTSCSKYASFNVIPTKKKINQQTVRSQAVTYWVIYQ